MTNSHTKKPPTPDVGPIPGDFVDMIKSHTENFEAEMKNYIDSTTEFVRKNPLTSAVAALALGYIIGRIASRPRVIIREK